jgi:hypothetical protein
VKLYRWPPPEGTRYLTESGLKVEDGGLLQDMPSNCPTDIAIRVYVLRAIGLCSQDSNGKSDPYLLVKLGSCTLTDKDNYVSQQLDPVFGRLELQRAIPVCGVMKQRYLCMTHRVALTMLGTYQPESSVTRQCPH